MLKNESFENCSGDGSDRLLVHNSRAIKKNQARKTRVLVGACITSVFGQKVFHVDESFLHGYRVAIEEEMAEEVLERRGYKAKKKRE